MAQTKRKALACVRRKSWATPAFAKLAARYQRRLTELVINTGYQKRGGVVAEALGVEHPKGRVGASAGRGLPLPTQNVLIVHAKSCNLRYSEMINV